MKLGARREEVVKAAKAQEGVALERTEVLPGLIAPLVDLGLGQL